MGSNPASPTIDFVNFDECMKQFFILLIMLLPLTAQAACYTPEQYRAEQAVRFHTNLMVVGLYCKSVLQQDTYATYQAFTRRNQNIIQQEENRLIAFFKQARMASPERQLHSMRTDLANKISLQAGQGIGAFCHRFASAYMQSKTMIPRDFQRWIEQISPDDATASSHPVCAAAQR